MPHAKYSYQHTKRSQAWRLLNTAVGSTRDRERIVKETTSATAFSPAFSNSRDYPCPTSRQHAPAPPPLLPWPASSLYQERDGKYTEPRRVPRLGLVKHSRYCTANQHIFNAERFTDGINGPRGLLYPLNAPTRGIHQRAWRRLTAQLGRAGEGAGPLVLAIGQGLASAWTCKMHKHIKSSQVSDVSLA